MPNTPEYALAGTVLGGRIASPLVQGVTSPFAPVDPGGLVTVQTQQGPRAVPAFVAQRLAGSKTLPTARMVTALGAAPPVVPVRPMAQASPQSTDDQRMLEAHLRTKYGATPDLAARWAANIIADPNSPDRPLLDHARATHRQQPIAGPIAAPSLAASRGFAAGAVAPQVAPPIAPPLPADLAELPDEPEQSGGMLASAGHAIGLAGSAIGDMF